MATEATTEKWWHIFAGWDDSGERWVTATVGPTPVGPQASPPDLNGLPYRGSLNHAPTEAIKDAYGPEVAS